MDPINLNPQDANSSGGGKGSLIGAIIVVIVLIIGAIYLFSNKADAPIAPEGEMGATTTQDTTVDLDSAADLEAAAANIDVDGINADANALDTAVGQ